MLLRHCFWARHTSACFQFGANSFTPIASLKTTTKASQTQAAFAEELLPHAAESEADSPQAIDFDDAPTIFASKSTASLLQSYAILSSCRWKSLVTNAESLLQTSRALIGEGATEFLLEHTYYRHFCAGMDTGDLGPSLTYLMQRNLMPILQYGAEDDVSGSCGSCYSESAERGLDTKAQGFMRCIAACDNSMPGPAFMSVKMTAIAKPELLKKVSEVLLGIGGSLDRGHSSARLRHTIGSKLTAEELYAFDNVMRRITSLATALVQKGNMRMLIDAEHSYVQPAIDAIAMAMMQRFNQDGAKILTTYQCYLKDAADRVEMDLRRAAKEGWVWGAKAVRGAYMHLERARANELGYECPVQECLQATHTNYNSVVERVMSHVARRQAELVVATHNQESVESAIRTMDRCGIPTHSPGSGLYFGQLMGMADNLSLPLGGHGYNAYKICTYGSVAETVAFLIRRARENSDALGGCAKETKLIGAALAARINPFLAQMA